MEDEKYYKYLEVRLKDSQNKFSLYSSYEKQDENSETKLVPIDETDDFSIYGFPTEGTKVSNQDVLFEYIKNAKGVFEKLRLFETKTYYCKYDEEITVTSQNKKELEPKQTDKNLFSFKVINYLGKSGFSVKSNNIEKILSFEIIPIKIEYEDDYVQLTKDIADQCSQLLLDYTSPTNLNFNLVSDKAQRTPLEQFIFIRQFCSSKNIEYLMQCIKMNPDRILVTEDELKPFGTAPISKKFFSNPFSNSKNWCKQTNGYYFPELITTTRKYDSYNTPANQFIKFAFRTFIQICQNVLNYTNDKKHTYYDEAKYLKDFLEVILLDSFFDDVQDLSSMPINNQVLQKREGYSQIFNAFNMLDLAMQLDWEGQKDVYEGEARNIALLYEYWLVFKFIEIFRQLGADIDFDLRDEKSAKKFLAKENGLLISLKQGKKSYLPMILKDKGIKINFYYNRTFSFTEFKGTNYKDSYSRDFRPDYSLVIFPDKINDKEINEEIAINEGLVSFIHFDAKYRVTDITDLFGKEKNEIIKDEKDLLAPEELEKYNKNEIDNDDLEARYYSKQKGAETINTYNRGDLLKMHTYNDAIRRTVGSYVLYPGKEADNKDKKERFNVYDELLPGVGAFAIRPGDKKQTGEEAIKKFINDIIDFKTKESSRQYRKEYFENMVIQNVSDSSLNKQKVNSDIKKQDYTMIGFVRESYYKYLETKNLVPKSFEDKSCLGKEFYFYFHAIKDGKVYTLHKETSQARYLRLTLTDFYNQKIIVGHKFQELKPWVAEILSMELVSKKQLIELLHDFEGNTDFKADYYYVLKARITDLYDGGIVAISTEENKIISPYSPKIVEMENPI